MHIGKSNPEFSYVIFDSDIACADSISDLGIIIDKNLGFSLHIANIAGKARGRCAVFLRSFVSREPNLMLSFFTLYIRPLLEYGSVVWSPVALTMIESIQRHLTKNIVNFQSLSFANRLALLKMSSL